MHVEFYIVSFNTTTAHFFDAMASAVKRGVRVRLGERAIRALGRTHPKRVMCGPFPWEGLEAGRQQDYYL